MTGEIRKILDPPGSGAPPGGDVVQSAVLLMLRERDGDFLVWFIRRTEHAGDPFSGHVAFPGGKKKDEDETFADTVTREVSEELGFDAARDAEILGEMDFIRPLTPSVRHYAVKPFVAALGSETEFSPNYEVAECFGVPVSHLLDEKNRDVRKRNRGGVAVDDYVFVYRNHIIWGLTGRILHEFLARTRGVFPCRV